MDGSSVFRTGQTSAGLIKNNILFQPLLMVVGFGEIQKKKKNILSVVNL